MTRKEKAIIVLRNIREQHPNSFFFLGQMQMRTGLDTKAILDKINEYAYSE